MINLGIIGCGRILAAHLRGYRLLRAAGADDFRITALCARREDDARMYLKRGAGPPQRPAVSVIPGDPLAIGDEYLSDFQDDVEVQVYGDYRRMLDEAPIDAVNDFTTHALHHQVAEESLARGKHLLTQKPLAVSVAAGRRMCELAEAKRCVFGVFENFRFLPQTRQLRWLYGGGPGGRLQMILHGYFGLWWAPNRIVAETPWRHRAVEAGGISLDLGVHFFDQIRHVAGEIQSVAAQTAVLEPRRFTWDADGRERSSLDCDADDTFFASFETEQGVVGQLGASWAGHVQPTSFETGAVFLGTQAKVSGESAILLGHAPQPLDDLYRQRADLEESGKLFPYGLSDSFALGQHDWLNAIRHGRQPEISGWEGLRDLAAAYAIVESAHLGRRVAVGDVLSGAIREYQRPIDAHFGLA